ncbi:unnamed protein product, partial [Polarella glacialis]
APDGFAKRLAFAPFVRVFVQREPSQDNSEAENSAGELAHVRRSMQLQLRAVPLQNFSQAEASEAKDGDEVDIIRVAAATDLRRLSGLVVSRWEQAEAGLPTPIVLQAMGPKSINIMVRSLAAAWQKSARSHEGDLQHAGFSCMPMHMEMAAGTDVSSSDPGEEEKKLYSGVKCILVRSAEDSR